MTAPAPTIPVSEAAALRRYGRDWMGARTDGNGWKRTKASDALKHARAILTPTEVAALDMTAGRGLSMSELAAKTGRTTADLAALIIGAAERLAPHYEQMEVLDGQG